MPTALTIAASDPGGGSGIQADLRTFAALGVFGTSAVTAVTAQNTLGVTVVHPLPADLVTAQVEAVAADIGADVVKTGLLATAAIVEAVAAAIESLDLPRVVVDPVLFASTGDPWLSPEAAAALRAELLPRAFVVTPNVAEAEALAEMTIPDVKDARRAARRIRQMGPQAVVVMGGHLEGPEVVDVLWDGTDLVEVRAPRVGDGHRRGAGCVFASALAARLATGAPLAQAVAAAQAFVAGAIRHAMPLGRGHGPLDPCWASRAPASPEPR